MIFSFGSVYFSGGRNIVLQGDEGGVPLNFMVVCLHSRL
jgi:hypothetical protein